MNSPLARIAFMNPLNVVLTLAAVAAFAPPPAMAESRPGDPPPVIVCADAPLASCGNPMCPIAQKSVGRRKADLDNAHKNGSPTKVRKAKKRLANARQERHESCRGSGR